MQPRERNGPWRDVCCSLVALALAVFAVAALIPPFLSQKHGGGPYSCAGNLRQLGLACSMYHQDWDDRYPPAVRWMDATSIYSHTSTTTGKLVSDRTMRNYRCPAVRAKHADAFGYVYNSRLSHRPYTPKPPAGRQFDPTTPMIFDGQWTERNASAMDSSAFSPRHAGGSLGNVAFIDGHVKALQRIDLSVRFSK